MRRPPATPLHYFDNNATTRVAPEVREVMLPFLTEQWGNPSSIYRFGRETAAALETARRQLAALLNAEPTEIVFTGCGTESNNTAFNNALACLPQKRHFIVSSVEHSSVLKFAQMLAARKFDVTFLPVEPDGSLDLHRLQSSIRPDTALVSLMWANNETGLLFPIDEIAALCRSHGVWFHTDAVQAAGKIPLDVRATPVDMLSLAGHKFHAPKGVGALFVRNGLPFGPYLVGGGQERSRRGGTENVASIVGFGHAAHMALQRLQQQPESVKPLRDRLERGILKQIKWATRNGAAEPRLHNTVNIAFPGLEAEAILLLLDHEGICASSGSACTTGSLEPSHVLTAMGLDANRARSSIRFSLGIYNTATEVDYVVETLARIVSQLHETPSPVAPPRRGLEQELTEKTET